MKHRGETARKWCEESGLEMKEIAKRITNSDGNVIVRRTLYNWFEEPELDWGKLWKVAKAVKRIDILNDFPELRKYELLDRVAEPEVVYGMHNVSEVKAAYAELQQKYLNLLEKYVQLTDKMKVDS